MTLNPSLELTRYGMRTAYDPNETHHKCAHFVLNSTSLQPKFAFFLTLG